MVKIYRYYDAKKLAKADNVRVKDIIEYLSKLNPEASMTCCGADLFYFHSSEDGNMITMDNELLEDAYEVFKIKEDIPSIDSKESKEEKYIVSSCIKTEPITITVETRDKLINKLIMDNIMKDIMTKRYLKENNITLSNKKMEKYSNKICLSYNNIEKREPIIILPIMSAYNGLKDDKDTTNYEIKVIINIKDKILFEKVSNMIYFNLAGLDEYINSDIVLNIDDGENIILWISGDCNRIPHFINTICY